MKAQEYIARVYEQLASGDGTQKGTSSAVVLHAALSVIQEVESPLKEETLVKLALLEIRNQQHYSVIRKRAAC
jgi:hypothetical protein